MPDEAADPALAAGFLLPLGRFVDGFYRVGPATLPAPAIRFLEHVLREHDLWHEGELTRAEASNGRVAGDIQLQRQLLDLVRVGEVVPEHGPKFERGRELALAALDGDHDVVAEVDALLPEGEIDVEANGDGGGTEDDGDGRKEIKTHIPRELHRQLWWARFDTERTYNELVTEALEEYFEGLSD